MSDSKVQKVYAAKSAAEQEAAYDDWAENYEPDLCAMGYRMPAVIAAAFVRYVPADAGPILDAGCGGGIASEALATMGYGPMTGIDLSEGMLNVARKKNIYADLQQATLGEQLPFPDNHFAAILSCGVITAGHAPAHAFEELTRISQPGAPIIFTYRDHPPMPPEYPAMLNKLEADGVWKLELQTPPFYSMPYGEPEVTTRVLVYRVC